VSCPAHPSRLTHSEPKTKDGAQESHQDAQVQAAGPAQYGRSREPRCRGDRLRPSAQGGPPRAHGSRVGRVGGRSGRPKEPPQRSTIGGLAGTYSHNEEGRPPHQGGRTLVPPVVQVHGTCTPSPYFESKLIESLPTPVPPNFDPKLIESPPEVLQTPGPLISKQNSTLPHHFHNFHPK